MSFTKQAKPTTSFTSQAKPQSPKIGKFGIGKFGQARFDQGETGYDNIAKPTENYTKIAKS